MTTPAPAPAPAPVAVKPRAARTYLILREIKNSAAVTCYELVAAGTTGNNAEHALRTWADNVKAGQSTGVYVALPASRFKPTGNSRSPG